jgi:nucleotide-binding universal stress UspA family protein
MLEVQRILCPVDCSPISTRALDHAVALASFYGARLTVLHVRAAVPGFNASSVPLATTYAPADEESGAEMDRFLGPARAAGVAAEALLRFGDPVPEILREAEALGPDLLVMGTHGRGGFERWVLGSVTEKVLRKAVCPVLTVPPHAEDSASPAAVKSILCPVDFSEASLRSLEHGFSLAQEADARLTLLYVAEGPPEIAGEGSWFEVPEYFDHVQHLARERLAMLVPKEARQWCLPHVLVVKGKPHREIVRVAQEHEVDLIVMGVHGKGVVDLALFGSTANQVVRSAPCPVLTVRPSRAA